MSNVEKIKRLLDALGAVRCYVIFATGDERLSPAGREEAEARLAVVNAALDIAESDAAILAAEGR